MERSSYYRMNRFLHVHSMWTLVLVSAYSIPFNLYRGEIVWMTLGLVGSLFLTERAIKSTAIDFPEAERRWLAIDEMTGGRKISLLEVWKDISFREFLKMLIKSRKNE